MSRLIFAALAMTLGMTSHCLWTKVSKKLG